jgi:chemotaxis methyl-accepting protein methylase
MPRLFGGEQLHCLFVSNVYLGGEMEKTMTASTLFYRNPIQLFTVFELCKQLEFDKILKMDFFGCSNGSEVYTFLIDYLVREEPFQLEISGYDILKNNIEAANKGEYFFLDNKLPACIPWYASKYFNRKTDKFCINTNYPVNFEVKDVCNTNDFIGMEKAHITSAQNIFIHMDRERALQGLSNLYDHTRENGLLLLGGCGLDLISEFTQNKNLIPITNNIRIIHESWAINRRANQKYYWHFPPIDDRKNDWEYRYCTIFQKRK